MISTSLISLGCVFFFSLPALDVCFGRHTAMTAQACKGGNVCMCLRFVRSGGWSGGLCLCVCVCVVNHY